MARDEGEGAVVTLGGAGALTNEELGEADNGLLAVVLLAPEGDETVAVLPPPAGAAGGGSAASST